MNALISSSFVIGEMGIETVHRHSSLGPLDTQMVVVDSQVDTQADSQADILVVQVDTQVDTPVVQVDTNLPRVAECNGMFPGGKERLVPLGSMLNHFDGGYSLLVS